MNNRKSFHERHYRNFPERGMQVGCQLKVHCIGTVKVRACLRVLSIARSILPFLWMRE